MSCNWVSLGALSFSVCGVFNVTCLPLVLQVGVLKMERLTCLLSLSGYLRIHSFAMCSHVKGLLGGLPRGHWTWLPNLLLGPTHGCSPFLHGVCFASPWQTFPSTPTWIPAPHCNMEGMVLERMGWWNRKHHRAHEIMSPTLPLLVCLLADWSEEFLSL